MREYRFRAKDLRTDSFVYGDLNDWTGSPKIGALDGAVYDIDPDTVGQYTGLKDKNGVEIYEGDIVEFATSKNHYRGSVEFGKGMYTVKCVLDFYLNEIVERGCEVIGNIHENPELLS